MAGDRTQALDTFFAVRADEGLSFVALVATDGETVFAKAYGKADRKREIPNQVATAFDIGSISKTFTAAAIYELANQDRLGLDDRVELHFEEVPEDKSSITVDHLLNHRSGLPQYHDRKGDFERMSREKALGRILGLQLRSAPGEQYGYSNAGYTLLALLVEKITGKSFRDTCREFFFEPLGMSRTGFYGDRELWKLDRVATGYGDSREEKNSPWYWRGEELWAVEGNGGIVSTAEDLLRWSRARSRWFPLPETPESLAEKRTFSAGWFLRKHAETGLQVFHGGATDKGFIAMLRGYPAHDTTLILLSNTYRADKPHICNYMDEIEGLLFGPAVPESQEVP